MKPTVTAKRETGVKEVTVVCKKCGSKDVIKLYPGQAVPRAVNCWKCKAGYGMQAPQMIESACGMFPVDIGE